MRPSLSACVITLDEEIRLPACLASLGFCDEIIVVDSGSSDGTVAIARTAGARVVSNAWHGFAAQRNVALEAATGEWVVEVDADERLEPALAIAIQRFLGDAQLTDRHDIAMLPMRHRFLGRELSAAMQAPGYRPRLFRRDAYRHDEARSVHEGLHPRGPAFPIDDGAMLHELASTWAEAVADSRAYARLEAAQYDGAVTPATVLEGALARPLLKMGYRLVVDGGWRDHWQGAVRICLESAADAGTWIHLAGAGRRPGRRGHFGKPDERLGAPKVAAAVVGRDATAVAATWLQAAASAGAEAVLISACDVAAPAGVRCRRVHGRGLRALARAADAEHQARPLDGLLVAGPAARARLWLSRAAGVQRLAASEDPAAAVARVAVARP